MGTLLRQQCFQSNADDTEPPAEGTSAYDENACYDEVDMGLMTVSKQTSFESQPGEGHFDMRRNFVHSLLDVALLLANVSQLKMLLQSKTAHAYFIVTLLLICASILLQIVIAIIMIMMWSLQQRSCQEDTSNNKNDPKYACTGSSLSLLNKRTVSQDPSEAEQGEVKVKSKIRKVQTLDRVVLILIMCVILVNVFITGLGITDNTGEC